tara:strand:+ start:1246 stop:1350 length:105 start_codon:yes stop_codon:yes gene_type:complete
MNDAVLKTWKREREKEKERSLFFVVAQKKSLFFF